MRSSMILALVAVALTVAASGYWAFGPVNSETSCTADHDFRVCTSNSESLVESEGAGILWVLAVPVALAGAIGGLVWWRRLRWLAWVLALLFWVACLVALASIGLFYVPAAIAAVVAVAVWVQGEPRA